MTELFVFFFLFVVVLIVILLIILTKDVFVNDAPVIFSSRRTLITIFNEISFPDDAVLLDIGFGDGRVLQCFLESYPKGRGIGIEKGLLPYLFSCVRLRKKKVELYHFDIFDETKSKEIRASFQEATHVFLYLYPEMLEKLTPLIESYAKRGVVIICLDFPLPHRKVLHAFSISGGMKTLFPSFGKKVFVYKV